MSQQAALRELDADLHAAFTDAGFADTGDYRAPGVPMTAPADVAGARVYVNRGVQRVGEFGQILAPRDEIELLREDVDAPKKDASLLVDGVRYLLMEKSTEDDALTTWVVRRG